MQLIRWPLFVIVVASLSGCASMLHARGFDPTPNAPCGVNGLVCSGSYEAHNASCCTADLEECGCAGPTCSCPEGYCCSVNGPEPNPNSLGMRRMRPQFTAGGR